MQQRLDIQCLRAFAVIAVLIYHAYPQLLPGGFVGVDVFFVISGFLMTRIVAGRLQEGGFNLKSFYGSRTRRIIPALLLCILVFYVLAFFSGLYADDLGELRRSSRSALLGYSNIYFYLHTGYFDMAATSQIFLHTWSLGVELQFYLIYPLLMLACTRFLKMSCTQVVAGLFALSFAASCILVALDQTAAFYLLPGRIWEFMTGGLLAVTGWSLQKQAHKSIVLWLGLAVIIVCALLAGSKYHAYFPGVMALVPCFGAFLFMLGGQGIELSTFPNRLPLNRFFGFTGNLSYSLYLWHWPVLVLYRFLSFNPVISFSGFLFCLAVICLCSYLSWRFVEEPVRKRFPRLPWKKQLACLGLGLGLFPLVGLPLKNSTFLYSEEQQLMLSAAQDMPDFKENAVLGNPERPVSFLLMGDSHAHAVSQCLSELAQEQGKAGRLVWQQMPLLNINVNDGNDRPRIGPKLLSQDEYEVVYIVLRWGSLIKGLLPHEYAPTLAQTRLHYSVDGRESWGAEAAYDALRDTVEFFTARGVKRVYILLPVPETHFTIPKSVANLAFFYDEDGINRILGVGFEEYAERQADILNVFNRLDREYEAVELLDLRPLLRGESTYKVISEGRVLYYDDDHLSNTGARLLAPLFTLSP